MSRYSVENEEDDAIPDEDECDARFDDDAMTPDDIVCNSSAISDDLGDTCHDETDEATHEQFIIEDDGKEDDEVSTCWNLKPLRPLSLLAQRNKFLPFDGAIEFDEPVHRYYVDGEAYPISVSGVISELEHHFDDEAVASQIAGRGRFAGKTSDQILAEWKKTNDEQRDLGTSMHLLCERYFNDDISLASLKRIACRHRPEIGQFVQFLHSHVFGKLEPVRTELRVFDRDYRVAGSVDIIFRRIIQSDDDKTSGELVMGDFKRSKSIDSEHKYNRKGRPKQMMKAPLETWHDSNLYHYTLQMNLYRVIIEKNTNYRIAEMFLIVMHPNQSAPSIVHIPDRRKEALYVLECRAARLVFETQP